MLLLNFYLDFEIIIFKFVLLYFTLLPFLWGFLIFVLHSLIYFMMLCKALCSLLQKITTERKLFSFPCKTTNNNNNNGFVLSLLDCTKTLVPVPKMSLRVASFTLYMSPCQKPLSFQTLNVLTLQNKVSNNLIKINYNTTNLLLTPFVSL